MYGKRELTFNRFSTNKNPIIPNAIPKFNNEIEEE